MPASKHGNLQLDYSAGEDVVVLLEVDKAHDLDVTMLFQTFANHWRNFAWRWAPCNGASRSIFTQCAILDPL
jgi:hypothetical protein